MNFKITEKAVLKNLDIGIPSALQMLFEVGIFTAAIWLSGTLGKIYQAANQIAFNLSAITFMVGVGLGVAAMIRVGNQKACRIFFHFAELRFRFLC